MVMYKIDRRGGGGGGLSLVKTLSGASAAARTC